jgi:hypothetical protein
MAWALHQENHKAFLDLTAKDTRHENRIWLEDGEPIIFGLNDEYGITFNGQGARVVEVSDVGRHNIHVHNASSPNPSVAFALSRLAHGPFDATPLGIFRNVPVPSYGHLLEEQIEYDYGDCTAIWDGAPELTVDTLLDGATQDYPLHNPGLWRRLIVAGRDVGLPVMKQDRTTCRDCREHPPI